MKPESNAGLWDSPWPAEDGGPRRQLVPRAPGLGLRAGERLEATTRYVMFANMGRDRAEKIAKDFDGIAVMEA